jgi:hypothetical protein
MDDQQIANELLEQRLARLRTWPAPARGALIGLYRRLADADLTTEQDQDELALLMVSLEDRKACSFGGSNR